jgi:hypothetical protein
MTNVWRFDDSDDEEDESHDSHQLDYGNAECKEADSQDRGHLQATDVDQVKRSAFLLTGFAAAAEADSHADGPSATQKHWQKLSLSRLEAVIDVLSVKRSGCILRWACGALCKLPVGCYIEGRICAQMIDSGSREKAAASFL